jgi:nucleoside-diphosphate-sugar epimerase
MLKDKRILLTGPAGNIGYPLAGNLAKDNEVWGISRFGDPAERKRVDDLGVITRPIDLGSGDFGDLPDNFDYVLHLGAYIGGNDYDRAVQVNGEGTALLMTHCRKAKAILVMSTTGVYRPNPDPWHAFLETDPLGDNTIPGTPFYAISKTVEEGVTRACARQMNIPTIIVRMNAAYGVTGGGGLPGHYFESIRAGRQVTLRWDPCPYSVINDQDIFEQTEALIDAAAVPAPIVNWGGDEPVTAQQMCQLFGEILGVKPDVVVKEVPGTQRGVIVDKTRRLTITGPAKVPWRDGMKALAEAHLQRKTAA